MIFNFLSLEKPIILKQLENILRIEHLALYLTGRSTMAYLESKRNEVDFYKAKGIALAIVQLCGLKI